MAGPALAHFVTHLFSPPLVVAAVAAAVSLRHAPDAAEAFKWALLTALFASVAPAAIVVLAMRLGRVGELYVPLREQRPLPFALGAACALAGAVVLGALGAPAAVLALAWALAGGAVAATALTLLWKVSFHSAVAAGAATVLLIDAGWAGLVGAPLVALVGWARVTRGAHTPAQVVGGAILGAVSAGLIFALAS